MNAVEGECDHLSQQLEKSRALEQVNTEQIQKLEEQLVESQNLLRQKETELQAAGSEIRDLNILRQEWIQGAGESASHVSELQEQLTLQKVAIEEADQKLLELQGARDELRSANRDLDDELKKHRAQLESMGDLERRNVELVSSIENLQSRLGELTEASEARRLELSEQVESLEGELLQTTTLRDQERQEAKDNREKSNQELAELQQRCDEQMREIGRIQNDSTQRQRQLEDRVESLQLSLEIAKDESRKAEDAVESSNSHRDQVHAQLQEAERQLRELQSQLEAGQKAQESLNQTSQELHESRVANEDLVLQNLALEERQAELQQKLEMQKADIESRTEVLNRERQEHSAELGHWKGTLKELQLELESERQRKVMLQKEHQESSLPSKKKAMTGSRSLEKVSPTQKHVEVRLQQARSTDQKDGAPMLISRGQEPAQSQDYEVAELASRLSVFGRAKKGRILWIRRSLLTLVWVIALGLTAGLFYLVWQQWSL